MPTETFIRFISHITELHPIYWNKNQLLFIPITILIWVESRLWYSIIIFDCLFHNATLQYILNWKSGWLSRKRILLVSWFNSMKWAEAQAKLLWWIPGESFPFISNFQFERLPFDSQQSMNGSLHIVTWNLF